MKKSKLKEIWSMMAGICVTVIPLYGIYIILAVLFDSLADLYINDLYCSKEEGREVVEYEIFWSIVFIIINIILTALLFKVLN